MATTMVALKAEKDDEQNNDYYKMVETKETKEMI